jgi:hypothetical protein
MLEESAAPVGTVDVSPMAPASCDSLQRCSSETNSGSLDPPSSSHSSNHTVDSSSTTTKRKNPAFHTVYALQFQSTVSPDDAKPGRDTYHEVEARDRLG